MVKKITRFAIGIIAVLLVIAAVRVTRRCDGKDRSDAAMASAAGTSLPPKREPLAEDEVLACSRAFEEIGEAYSNLQFEKMQEIFCGISNNVARLGKDRLDKDIEALKTSFRERFWIHDVKLRRFSAVSEFERFATPTRFEDVSAVATSCGGRCGNEIGTRLGGVLARLCLAFPQTVLWGRADVAGRGVSVRAES